MKLELSKKEVEAVMSYIFQHCRAYPDSTAFKVWEKMFEFVNDEAPAKELEPYLSQSSLF